MKIVAVMQLISRVVFGIAVALGGNGNYDNKLREGLLKLLVGTTGRGW